MFSVIIPVYNKRRHLSRSIDSVLNQSVGDFELILVDDASTDGSYEFLSQLVDPRIKVYRRSSPGAGGYAARNLGIEKANSSWVCFLDADDEWERDYLEKMRSGIEEYPEVQIFSAAWYVNHGKENSACNIAEVKEKDKLAIISLEEFLALSIGNAPPICSSVACVKKDVFKQVGAFPAGLCKSGGDVDTWLRIVLETKQIGFYNKPLATYFVDSDNMVSKTQKKFEIGCIMRTIKKTLENPDTAIPQELLKKYSNKYLMALMAKTIKAGQFDKSFLAWYYKEVDFYKYLVFRSFEIRPLRSLYKYYLNKRNPFHG
jgi:succinoglycan biosynthesis protein ExoO